MLPRQSLISNRRAQAELEAVTNALFTSDDNVATAAKILGITRPTLYALMEKLGIKR